MRSYRRIISFFVLVLVVVSCQSVSSPLYVPTEESKTPYLTTTPVSPSPAFDFEVSQILVYLHPSWGVGENYLTDSEVASRFQLILRDRIQMLEDLPEYREAGFSGEVYVYLSGSGIAGPEGLESPQAQLTLCTDAQKSLPVFGNSVTMDIGDFCEIHDAIISQTFLPDYPDIFPTENWFVHSSDGTRFTRGYAGKGAVYYVINPGDFGWQTYFSRRALREIKFTDPSHLPIPQATGIFIDNLNSTFYFPSGFIPAEYSSLEEYEEKKLDMLIVTYQLLSQEGIPIIGNLSDMDYPESWDLFLPYLSGVMAESWISAWGDGILPPRRIEAELSLAERVLQQNKKFLGVFQGNVSGDYLKFAFANLLLIADHQSAYFKYKNYSGEYSEYYEIPEYFYKLGFPLGAREKISDDPLVYTREFECGNVMANLTTGEAEILYTC